MSALTPTTTIQWIRRLTTIVDACTTALDADVSREVWTANRDARTQAIILRDELLELTVATIEVTS